MEQIPVYIKILFVLCTLYAVLMLYKAASYSRPLILILLLWLALQGVLSSAGFYTVVNTTPPRFVLVLFPPLLFIAALFLIKKGRAFIGRFDMKTLMLIHVVRIVVELGLYSLYLHKAVPKIMTFEGGNIDVFCGITAPVIYYFAFVKNVFGKRVLLAWNILCLLSLGNIVVTAILSAPFPFQEWGFEQPNVAILYFPVVWLPGCIVPVVLLAHLAAVRKLARG